MTYFLDSNIVSYILNGKSAIKNRIEELLLQGNDIFIPTFVYYEIKRGLLAVGATSKLERFNNFVKTLGLINLTMQTYDMAANVYALLKKQGLLIEDAEFTMTHWDADREKELHFYLFPIFSEILFATKMPLALACERECVTPLPSPIT
jgi:tRNA(fMet)-specific endonuclease VapC